MYLHVDRRLELRGSIDDLEAILADVRFIVFLECLFIDETTSLETFLLDIADL
ncbi:MAG: hypothetical protein ACI80F_001962 [Natronomonas sp.]